MPSGITGDNQRTSRDTRNSSQEVLRVMASKITFNRRNMSTDYAREMQHAVGLLKFAVV
jgi:hypothetical protein